MSNWRYFVETTTYRDEPDRRRYHVMRLRADEPLLCAEARYADGTWHRNDQLFKQMMLGSDSDYVEVDEARFAEVLAMLGPTSDESFERPSEEELARLRSTEKRIADAWRSVPIPPGAAEITFPVASD